MTTPAHRLIQDQNLNFLYSGAATPGGKTDATKADKKGGLGGRKALNDISNSRKPSGFHSVKKDNFINVISIEKDPSAVKAKLSKAADKGKIGGRKALSDLTNSVKPPTKQVGRKLLNAVAEEDDSTCKMDERFLHNHQKCIKAQTKAVDKDYFLLSVGLSNDTVLQPSTRSTLPFSSKKRKNSMKHLEMEEIPENLFEDQILPGNCSPACRSPKSPKAPYTSWGDDDFSDLMMIESPKA